MLGMGFKEEDKDNFVAALNFIAKEAKFKQETTVEYAIQIRNHFAFLQSIAVKIDKALVDDVKIHEPKKEEKKKSKGKAK